MQRNRESENKICYLVIVVLVFFAVINGVFWDKKNNCFILHHPPLPLTLMCCLETHFSHCLTLKGVTTPTKPDDSAASWAVTQTQALHTQFTESKLPFQRAFASNSKNYHPASLINALLMQRTDSLEKTLMLGKIEGKRRREWQRMRWMAL